MAMERTLESWCLCDPAAIAGGSEAQSFYALQAAQHDILQLAEALAFYRDGFRFHPGRGPTGIDRSTWQPTTDLLDDCGNIARAALKSKEPS